jgi:starch-binding outer membrane protein, SusD/RagB family
MKKIKLYCLLFAVLTVGFSFHSCDSFFETTSNSVYSAEDVFSDPNTALMAVYGIYNMASNAWSKRVSQYFAFDDDLCVNDITAATSSNQILLGRYKITSGNGELHSWHYAMVRGVVRANICIQQLKASPLINSSDEEEKAEMRRLLGESYVMRAVMMSEIVKIWGDVPYSSKASEAGDIFEIAKTDRDTIYGELIQDLIKAVDLLPWRDEVASDERATKGSALAYIGRLCLLRGGYSLRVVGTPQQYGEMKRSEDYLTYYRIADKYLKILIESGKHTLNPSFYDQFKNMCELTYDKGGYGESLLEIAWAGGASAVSGEVGSYMGPKINSSSSFGLGSGAINVTPTYYLMFDQEKDARFNTMIAPYEIDKSDQKIQKTLTTMYPGKIRRDWRVPLLPGTSKYTDINWPLMRYSDALLMYAEVENELNNGPTTAATEAFEQVRKRAYKGYESQIGETPATKDAFFEAIVKERALELASEGVRKYDLLRWNRLYESLAQVKTDAIKIRDGVAPYNNVPDYVWYKYDGSTIIKTFTDPNDANYTRVNWRKAIDDSYLNNLAINNFIHGQSELYPFGTATIAANPKLVNDFGY